MTEKGGYTISQLVILGVIGIVVIVSAVGLGLGIGLRPEPETTAVAEGSSEGNSEGTVPTTTVDGEVEIPLDGKTSRQGKYRYAAVATDAEVCSTIGTDVMARQGGSAVDAAIAALLCVGVCNAHSTGIGGGHFMTVYIRDEKLTTTFMAREVAPGNSTADMFKQPNTSSVEGGLSIGVPGEVGGMFAAHQKFGRLPWKSLFAPTIKLCREGIPVYKAHEAAIKNTLARGFLEKYPELKQLLTNPATDEVYKVGDKMKRLKFATTLEKIANEGPDAFYNGSLTDDIAGEIQDAGGIVTADDLSNYTVLEQPPVTYLMEDDLTVFTPRPPSSGLVLSYILNILDSYNLTKDDISTTEKKVLTYHRIIEAFKFAYAKRTSLGDERFLPDISQLIQNLTSPEYGRDTRAKITDDRTHNYTYYEPVFAQQPDPTGTAHLSVLAPNGDAVSVTSTINLYFGSKVVGRTTGIIYNDEMDDFSTPGVVNAFKIPASPANFIRPGKRPLSSMSPSIFVDKDDDVRLIIGASGGTQITTTIAWVAMRALWFGDDMRAAIDDFRLHHQLVPDFVRYDTGLPQAVIDGLKTKGHDMRELSVTSVCQGILVSDDSIYACSDRRKGGVPDGY